MLPRGHDCPDILLELIRGLVGEGDSVVTVPSALHTLTLVSQMVQPVASSFSPEGTYWPHQAVRGREWVTLTVTTSSLEHGLIFALL